MYKNESELTIQEIYKNLGISDCYDKDGGIGFGLLESGLLGSHTVVLSEDAYQILSQARVKTDETGIEIPFVIMGWYVPTDDDFALFCRDGLLGDNEINNGRVKMSSEFSKHVSEQIKQKNYGFVIICHTHPNYELTTFNREEYDKLLPYHNRLAIRDLGYNISNGDIEQLIELKYKQSEHNDDYYFLQGISLPNGEFNIIDIDSMDDNPVLVSLPKVIKVNGNNLEPIDNIWNKSEIEITNMEK